MKQININNIRTDGGTQVRLELLHDKVDEYAELMAEGVEFPPLIAFHDGSNYWLADGFHRYFAQKKNDASLINVDVRVGTKAEAKDFARTANNKHGMPLSHADRRNMIIEMLNDPDCATYTNEMLSEKAGVSKRSVMRVKQSLESDNESTLKTYVDKNNIARTVDTAKLASKKAVDKPAAERPVGTKPDSSTINEDKLAIAMLNDQISELSDTISGLSEENARLRDVIAVGQWDATDIEKMDIEDTVKELREQIRVLEIENSSLRDGRDSYMNRNSELQRSLKSMQARLKKYED
jgi:regulator of replication initiation timing